MAKRTLAKKIRAYDIVQGVTGTPSLKKRADGTLRPAEARMPFTVDCGSAGKHVVQCSEGQMINPWKMCKRLGGEFVPPTPKVDESAQLQDDASGGDRN